MISGIIDKNKRICGRCRWARSQGGCWLCDNLESGSFGQTVLYAGDACEDYEKYETDKPGRRVPEELLKRVQEFLDREFIEVSEPRSFSEGFGAPAEKKVSRRTLADRFAGRMPAAKEFAGRYDVEDLSDASYASECPPDAIPFAEEATQASYDVFRAVDIDEMIAGLGQTFQEKLLKTIDAKGLTDAQVYTKANIDRRLFSKIRCNKDYKPSKATALALAIALGLDLDETTDLLGRAGLALSPSSKADLIVKFCIINGIYNIIDVNSILYEYDQPLLGC